MSVGCITLTPSTGTRYRTKEQEQLFEKTFDCVVFKSWRNEKDIYEQFKDDEEV